MKQNRKNAYSTGGRKGLNRMNIIQKPEDINVAQARLSESKKLSKFGLAALEYAKKGWYVIPLTKKSKAPPMIKEWQNQATIDENIIRGWWTKWPDANVGIVVGELSGMIILDIDSPNHGTNKEKGIDGEESLKKLLETHCGTIPPTLTASTPSGGKHLFFKYPTGVTISNSSSRLAPGLDIKSNNGFIVVAPSITLQGEYIWDNPEVEVVACAKWLLDLITTKKNKDKVFKNTTNSPVLPMPIHGLAEEIINKCAFIQHCKDNAKIITEPSWLAMINNLARCVGGTELIHELSVPHANYSRSETDTKIRHALLNLYPSPCSYIKRDLAFEICPDGGCGVTAPYCLDNGRALEQAITKLENVQLDKDTRGNIFRADILPLLVDVDEFTRIRTIDRIKKPLGMTKGELERVVKSTIKIEQSRRKSEISPQFKPRGVFNDWRDNFSGTDYVIVDGELQTTKYVKNIYISIPIANLVARITKDIRKDDGLETKSYFEIEGFIGDRILPTISVKAIDFEPMHWVIDNWGSDVIIYPSAYSKGLLRHAIQVVSMKDKVRQSIYTHTGWRKIDETWAYLHGGGAIGVDNVAVDLTCEGALNQYTLPTVGEKTVAAKMSLQLLEVADYKITIPLLALTFLSPLCEPLRQAGKEPAFVVWVQGITQSMKTSLVAVFLSHFGSFTETNIPASFKSTAISIERKGNLLKDSLLLIDDYHPTGSKTELLDIQKKAQSILRAWGDRQARDRANIDGTLRASYKPKGMCVVTGESLPEVAQSGTARLLAVPIKQGDINGKKLEVIQNNTALLAQNMAGYLEWLSPQVDDITKGISNDINELRSKFNDSGYRGRMPSILATLLLGWRYALNYFEHIGALDKQENLDMLGIGISTLQNLVSDHAQTVRMEQPSLLFITALKEMIGAELVEILPISLMSIPKSKGNFIGWCDPVIPREDMPKVSVITI